MTASELYNIIIDAGSNSCNKFKQFVDLCHIFELPNLVNIKTCFNSAAPHSSLYVILTNRPRSFQKMAVITAGLKDYHKVMITTFRSPHTRKPPRNIISRNYKKFNPQDCLNVLETNRGLEEQVSTCVFND